MLTNDQIQYFHTFGFVALPGLLGGDRASALAAEVDSAIRDAYTATYDERVIDGISGHYLPMASALTPISTSLVCDDPVLVDAAEGLLGGPVLPSVPEGALYFAEAGWHNDDGIGVRGVKFATYFEPLNAENGALRFVPCSHHPDAQLALCSYQRAGHDDYPGVVVDSQPGDVVAFDLHSFHSSVGGTDRLAWAIEYLANPTSDEERDKTLRWLADAFEQEFRGFDLQRFPTWRDWIANPDHLPRRAEVIERMRSTGVFDLAGAELGR
ncbi:MAG: phytanoyl-CoA dioxygenase family protein [Acidimicrobiaceae bacterium]|nr:phytanoyl-CoA dioxygenase family protein [Acidimicrobiaceae bacterium]